jgi:hypothetical protein
MVRLIFELEFCEVDNDSKSTDLATDGYLLAAAKRGNTASMKEVLDEHKSEVAHLSRMLSRLL